MGTITKRTNPSGSVVYRALVRVKKAGYPDFSESRTFSKRALAVEWVKRRESEIEQNPDILFGDVDKSVRPTLRDAVVRYLDEAQKFSGTKRLGLLFLSNFELGKVRLNRLRREHFSEHILMRRKGISDLGIAPIAASTALQELQYIRTVLKYAHLVWGMRDVTWLELDMAVMGLREARIVAKSSRRNRLPTSDELQLLTTYFYQKWSDPLHRNSVPMHLIMWFAIYTCRRQDEIGRLLLADFRRDVGEWLVRDVKRPQGSEGNHKVFTVRDNALPVIDALLMPDVRRRMAAIARDTDGVAPIKAASIGGSFALACKMLGIDDLRFHDLRHEGATRLAEDGLNIPNIQQVTLHESWNSLQRYVNLRRRVERLDFADAMMVARGDIG